MLTKEESEKLAKLLGKMDKNELLMTRSSVNILLIMIAKGEE